MTAASDALDIDSTSSQPGALCARLLRSVRRVDKPWGHEEVFALMPGLSCGKVLHVRAGHALSLQYHEFKDETIEVQSGHVHLDVGA